MNHYSTPLSQHERQQVAIAKTSIGLERVTLSQCAEKSLHKRICAIKRTDALDEYRVEDRLLFIRQMVLDTFSPEAIKTIKDSPMLVEIFEHILKLLSLAKLRNSGGVK